PGLPRRLSAPAAHPLPGLPPRPRPGPAPRPGAYVGKRTPPRGEGPVRPSRPRRRVLPAAPLRHPFDGRGGGRAEDGGHRPPPDGGRAGGRPGDRGGRRGPPPRRRRAAAPPRRNVVLPRAALPTRHPSDRGRGTGAGERAVHEGPAPFRPNLPLSPEQANFFDALGRASPGAFEGCLVPSDGGWGTAPRRALTDEETVRALPGTGTPWPVCVWDP